MSTVTIAQYKAQTDDSTKASATVQANLDLAESMVEEFLRRELASEERTEAMRVWPNGLVKPKHVPVTSVQASASYSVEDTAQIKYVTPDDITSEVVGDYSTATDDYPHSLPKATVTYVGGWSSVTVPASIQRVVSLAAKALNTPASISPSGVEQASVGDISVKYANAGASEVALDALVPFASALLKGYRYRPA